MHLRRTACALPKGRPVRYASTSSASYPFPHHAHPTPHQIFHLPPGATQPQIKARYYELVRVHHPDSPSGRDLSPALRHKRFQSITAAYDILRGKSNGAGTPVDIYRAEIERRRRARAAYEASRGYAHTRPRAETWSASADERWKDRVILFVGLMALGAGLGPALVWPSYTASYQAHVSASKNLKEARKEAREFGEERRKQIRRRVQEYNELKAAQERPREDESRT
ncbi:uncharacterized protein TRAVEDRAFT_28849 [Trametes versicolor FP-101664 SS1]|uniref:uncharacterized protein n=1 Tax=Trametes versicolor (strain FP-101664) TaxID=717944 RepID=UPI0004623923|nr:uncharacterized protein TRAVEDRAFT_28849 [Trametes versicolor FP-101664 SS1]EIW59934.1 hypothetical protein TRAVEDRAFT_28849 [Trametes versicolor FP-101664 SS1]